MKPGWLFLLILLSTACGSRPQVSTPSDGGLSSDAGEPAFTTVPTWRIEGIRGDEVASSVQALAGKVTASFWRCSPWFPQDGCAGHHYLELVGNSLRTELVDSEVGMHTSLLTESGYSPDITAATAPDRNGKSSAVLFRRQENGWERRALGAVDVPLATLVSRLDDSGKHVVWAENDGDGVSLYGSSTDSPSAGPNPIPASFGYGHLPSSSSPLVIAVRPDGPRVAWADFNRLFQATLNRQSGSPSVSIEEITPAPASSCTSDHTPSDQAGTNYCELTPLQLAVDASDHSYLLVTRRDSRCQGGCTEMLLLENTSGSWEVHSVSVPAYWGPPTDLSGSTALRLDSAGRAYLAFASVHGASKTMTAETTETAILMGHNRSGVWSFQTMVTTESAGQKSRGVSLALDLESGHGAGVAYVGWFGADTFNISAFLIKD